MREMPVDLERMLAVAPPGYELRCRRLGNEERAEWWKDGRQVVGGSGADRAAAIRQATEALQWVLPPDKPCDDPGCWCEGGAA
jgi:hypothetical protein